MVTKEQHIDFWMNTAEEDWITVEAMFNAERYLHCLFWAHLVIEKLAKALWVKNNVEDIPPKTHDIVWLLQSANVCLETEVMEFLKSFNDFQTSTRYPNYTSNMATVCTGEVAKNKLEKVKEIRICLQNMLQ